MSTSAERMRRMRERQAAALARAPDPVPRDPADLLAPAIGVTLAALGLDAADAAAAQLARSYAEVIDQAQSQAWALRHLGPSLLACLESLGATPASRVTRKPAEAPPGGLDRLRASRRAGGAL